VGVRIACYASLMLELWHILLIFIDGDTCLLFDGHHRLLLSRLDTHRRDIRPPLTAQIMRQWERMNATENLWEISECVLCKLCYSPFAPTMCPGAPCFLMKVHARYRPHNAWFYFLIPKNTAPPNGTRIDAKGQFGGAFPCLVDPDGGGRRRNYLSEKRLEKAV
jgi:hypothetical protein